jgi:lipopolysaccharide transport system ATP-binding protein
MEEFWALKDVSFDVQPGEVVGIIGRNGAGKSTLLKILSRIVEPTEGEIRLRGRVASLLEVGTGFHPELTGRENIYLNGSILGMKRREIDSKFDEIVDFAEVEKFLDTPVKRYSSGMYVRLAFAVAAHLEPEILIVDEVLAVGDAEFQKKCLGKMKEVSTGTGRTVLFVSHNMLAVNSLCSSGLELAGGGIVACGTSTDVVNHYVNSRVDSLDNALDFSRRQGTGKVRLKSLRISHREDRNRLPETNAPAVFEIHYEANETLRNVQITIGIMDSYGAKLTRLSNHLSEGLFPKISPKGVFRCECDKLPLTAGIYNVDLQCNVNGVVADWICDANKFEVVETSSSSDSGAAQSGWGRFVFDHRWTTLESTDFLETSICNS